MSWQSALVAAAVYTGSWWYFIGRPANAARRGLQVEAASVTNLFVLMPSCKIEPIGDVPPTSLPGEVVALDLTPRDLSWKLHVQLLAPMLVFGMLTCFVCFRHFTHARWQLIDAWLVGTLIATSVPWLSLTGLLPRWFWWTHASRQGVECQRLRRVMRFDPATCKAVLQLHEGGFARVFVFDERGRGIGVLTTRERARWFARVWKDGAS